MRATIRTIIVTILAICFFLLAAFAHGQSSAPGTVVIGADNPPPAPKPSDTLETGWNVSVNGGFSNVSGQTNNGTLVSTAFRLAKHWNLRGDVYMLTDPLVTITLAKPEYRFSAQHLFRNSTFAAVKNSEFFVNAGAGAAHFTDPAQGKVSKFAWSVGGGFDVKMTDTVSIRPLDVSYLNSQLTGPKLIGNHLQFAATLGLKF